MCAAASEKAPRQLLRHTRHASCGREQKSRREHRLAGILATRESQESGSRGRVIGSHGPGKGSAKLSPLSPGSRLYTRFAIHRTRRPEVPGLKRTNVLRATGDGEGAAGACAANHSPPLGNASTSSLAPQVHRRHALLSDQNARLSALRRPFDGYAARLTELISRSTQLTKTFFHPVVVNLVAIFSQIDIRLPATFSAQTTVVQLPRPRPRLRTPPPW